MTFDTLKLENASDKFAIVRMAPARNVSDDLTILSGTTYTTTFAFDDVFSVTFYDASAETDATLLQNAGTPSSGEFSYDRTTNLLTVNLGVTIGVGDIVVAIYYVWYSNGPSEVYFVPDNTTADIRLAKVRLASQPSFQYNIRDFINGTFSLGNTSISILNADYDFNAMAGDNDSFKNRDVEIYFGYDSIDNVKRVYTGKTQSVTISETVTISINSNFDLLRQTYYPNGPTGPYSGQGELDTSIYDNFGASVYEADKNRIVPILYTEETSARLNGINATSVVDLEETAQLSAVALVNGADEPSGTNHRTWGTVLASSVNNGEVADTVQSVDTGPTNFDTYGYALAVGTYQIGDQLLIDGKATKIVGITGSTMDVDKIAGVSTTDTIVREGISAVIIEQSGNVQVLEYFDSSAGDFTITYTGGIRKIVFESNFEASYGSISSIGPTNTKVYYRAYGDTTRSYLHGDVVQNILEAAGFDVNAASITAANAEFGVPLDMSLVYPGFGKNSAQTFQNILQTIFKALFSYIRINDSNEIEYKVVKTLAPSITITDDHVLEGSFNIALDYGDLTSDVIVTNVNQNESQAGTSQSVSISNRLVPRLHNVRDLSEHDDVSDETDSLVLDRLALNLGLLSSRQATYSFTLAIRHDLNIGDEITLQHPGLLGTDTERDLLIVSVTKTPETIQIQALDLLGF